MQQLHDQFGSLEVTAVDQFDPARVIQELRRICIELDVLGDKVVPTRKTHAFLTALTGKTTVRSRPYCCVKSRVMAVQR